MMLFQVPPGTVVLLPSGTMLLGGIGETTGLLQPTVAVVQNIPTIASVPCRINTGSVFIDPTTEIEIIENHALNRWLVETITPTIFFEIQQLND